MTANEPSVASPRYIEGAVSIPRPAKVRTLDEFGMRGSVSEIPDPPEHWASPTNRIPQPDGWWVSAGATFNGATWSYNSYGELSTAEPVATANSCTAAFCVAYGRLFAIISPNLSSDPAVWVNATCSRVTVTTGHADGIGPTVALAGDGWTLEIVVVSRLYRRYTQKGMQKPVLQERLQAKQEQSFVDAVSGASGFRPTHTAATPDTVPSQGAYRWLQRDCPDGLYRLERLGELTTATALVDRELPVDAQVRHLEAIDWMPSAYPRALAESITSATMLPLYRPALPAGRLNQPLRGIHLVTLLTDRSFTHPLSRYLWPSLNAGVFTLDANEVVVWTNPVPAVRVARFNSAAEIGLGIESGSQGVTAPRLLITNQRVAVVANRDPSKISIGDQRKWWGVHFRHEWIYEAGTIERTSITRTLTGKVKDVKNTSAAYARLTLPSGYVHELNFAELPNSNDFVTRVVEAVTTADPTRQSDPEGVASTESNHSNSTRRYVRISNAIPYSIPTSLSPELPVKPAP